MPQETANQTLQEKAEAVYAKAPETLKEFESAYIFRSGSATRREFPKFGASEIKMGELLGTGGFSGVKEVLDIELNDNDDDGVHDADEKTSEDTDKLQLANVLGHDHDHHYDVSTARTHMAKHTQRLGSARYAIKRLKQDLDELERARGALDLAIETKLMSSFWHPNIVKMRGTSNTESMSTETFIIMDRLYGTLNDKIENWHQEMAMLKGCCGINKKHPAYRDSIKARLLVAYDLSVAFSYLHSHRLVYRDIKPENIGFDIRGDVKIFDFGLCRSLEQKDKVLEGGYKLTAKTGSIPYMAPEVVLNKPYDKSADVFSFGILLWELLTLDWAFNGLSAKDFFIQVAKHGQRLPLPKDAPPMTRSILPEAWHEDQSRRPTMKRIGAVIRGELEDIAADAEVLNRTQHMINRSYHSQRGFSSHKRKNTLSNSRKGRNSFIGGDVCGSEKGRHVDRHIKLPCSSASRLFSMIENNDNKAETEIGYESEKEIKNAIENEMVIEAEEEADDVALATTNPSYNSSTQQPRVTSDRLRYHDTHKTNYRMKVFATLNDPKVELLAATSVVFSTFLVALGTLPNLAIETYAIIEEGVIGLNVLFMIDFFLRWYAAGQFKLIYLTKPLAIIDLFVVIIPLFLGSVMPMLDSFGGIGLLMPDFHLQAAGVTLEPAAVESSGLQVLLLLRVLRLKRVLTDIQTFRRFAGAIGIRRSDVRPYQLQLARVLLSIFTLLSVASGLIYTAEHAVNPAIPDYFTALYFGLTTLTTVGFGDIVPVTFNGRLVVCGSILAGVAVIPAQAAKLVDAVIASQEEKEAGMGTRNTNLSSLLPGGTRRSIATNNATDGLGPSGTDLEVPPKDVTMERNGGNTADSYKVCGSCRATGHRTDATFCFNCGSKI
ncbi:MAG: hypothetical protein SGBAC_003738 [Bacillariaceae sp.]